jgi:uncharacterized RDD family membrane protein YckC
MAQAPASPPLRVSEFYERKRRLAYQFAWVSMTLLLVQLWVGSVLEFYSHPRATAVGDSIWLLHRCLTQDEVDGSRLLRLDPAFKLQGEALRLLDTVTAVLPEGRDVTVFYGSHAALLTDLKSSRTVDLGQKWDVLAALADPAREAAWIFGWSEGKIVARRRDKSAWAPEIAIAQSGLVDRLSASIETGAGPLVAWRERASTKVKTALFTGQAFVLRAEFEIGDAPLWDVVLSQGRTLLSFYRREDRSFEYVTIRLDCCPDCPRPAASRKISFADPVLLVGRKVTGLSSVVQGDRLRYLLTRPSTIMASSIPLATLEPDAAAARLLTISVEPAWRKIIGSMTPMLLVFCSISMVFIGVTLLRERARVAAAIPLPAPGPAPSSLLARAMAYTLDLILLLPVLLALPGLLDVSDLDDPRFLWVVLIWLGTEFLYHFVLEWRFGWTFGKRILGMRVTGIDGGRLTLRGALLRNLARVIDAQVPFGVILGVGLMLKTQRRQRLGDVVGRTMVIQDFGPQV